MSTLGSVAVKCKNILHFEMWVTFFAKKLPNSSGKPMNSKCQSKATRP